MTKLSMSLSAETTEREYKREGEFKNPKSWLKTVSAFFNGIGGTIYFGVNDDKEKFKFYSDRSGFKVTFVNGNYNRKIEKNDDKPAINASDKILNKMVKDESLISEGANKNRIYKLKKNY